MVTPSRIVVILLLLSAAACHDTLETGYVPHHLNASDSERRSYYAPAFTPESRPSGKDDHGPPPDLSMPR